jgi:hypothetical protein
VAINDHERSILSGKVEEVENVRPVRKDRPYEGSGIRDPGFESRIPSPESRQDQKSICALNFTKRGCSVDCGASQFADGLVVLIVGLNAWL